MPALEPHPPPWAFEQRCASPNSWRLLSCQSPGFAEAFFVCFLPLSEIGFFFLLKQILVVNLEKTPLHFLCSSQRWWVSKNWNSERKSRSFEPPKLVGTGEHAPQMEGLLCELQAGLSGSICASAETRTQDTLLVAFLLKALTGCTPGGINWGFWSHVVSWLRAKPLSRAAFEPGQESLSRGFRKVSWFVFRNYEPGLVTCWIHSHRSVLAGYFPFCLNDKQHHWWSHERDSPKLGQQNQTNSAMKPHLTLYIL